MANVTARIPKVMECEPADRKLRIAIVYSRSPLPMRRADQMTVAHLIAFLHARGHDVDLHALKAGGDVSSVDEEWLTSHCTDVNLYEHRWLDAAKGLLYGLFKGFPLQVGIFLNGRQRAEVHERVRNGEYDIVYVYYLRSGEVAKGLGHSTPSGKKVDIGAAKRPATFLALQLSQALNTRRIAENAPDIWHKMLYAVESRLVARYETKIWREYTRSVIIGPKDLETIRAECDALSVPRLDNHVYGAHGTDVARFKPKSDVAKIPGRIVFSGVMRTPTNVQAAQWFVANVWPLVLAEVPEATFEIVGREPTAEVMKLGKVVGVQVTGTVPDPAINIAAAEVCVNPMQAGGGMQNKLIEFLASQKPVVATSVANEGIMAPDDCLVVADDPKDFAAAVIRLLRNPVEAEAMAERARAHVLANWTWEAHFLKLEKDFYGAL